MVTVGPKRIPLLGDEHENIDFSIKTTWSCANHLVSKKNKKKLPEISEASFFTYSSLRPSFIFSIVISFFILCPEICFFHIISSTCILQTTKMGDFLLYKWIPHFQHFSFLFPRRPFFCNNRSINLSNTWILSKILFYLCT